MALNGIDAVDYYMALERRVARLERTSTVQNSSTDTTFVGLLNVTGLTVSSQTVVAYGVDYQVYIKFAWNAVTLDANVITDDPVKGYYTSWTKDGTNYTAEQFTDTTTATVGPLAQGQTITFRVRTVTQKDTFGAYATTTISSTVDNTAPNQPSTPTVVPYLGQLRVFWNGLDVSSNPMPSDLRYVEIHMSTSGIAFTPTTATLVDTFDRTGGYYTITDLTYGTTYYFRLVPVDQVGNRGVASTGASAVPVQAADGDIASMSIGKLTVGTLSADMTVSARIKTGNTGARVELNSTGLKGYNSSNVNTVDINASTGSATILGTFQTGLSGRRIIIDPSGFSTIYFYPTTGSNYAYINAPDGSSGGATIGLNAATYTPSGTAVFHRLFLTDNTTELKVARASDQADYGGYVHVSDTAAQAGFVQTGANWRSQISLSQNTIQLTQADASSVTNSIEITDTHIYIITQNDNITVQSGGSTILVNSGGGDIQLDANAGGKIKMRGKFDDAAYGNDNSYKQGETGGSGNTISLSWGATMSSQTDTVCVNEAGDTVWCMTGSSSTGWSLHQAVNQGVNINFWGARR